MTGSVKSAGTNRVSSANSNSEKTSSNYTVKKGDTLSKIAQNHDTSVKEMMAANSDRVKDANKIGIGQVLRLPTQNSVKKPVSQNIEVERKEKSSSFRAAQPAYEDFANAVSGKNVRAPGKVSSKEKKSEISHKFVAAQALNLDVIGSGKMKIAAANDPENTGKIRIENSIEQVSGVSVKELAETDKRLDLAIDFMGELSKSVKGNQKDAAKYIEKRSWMETISNGLRKTVDTVMGDWSADEKLPEDKRYTRLEDGIKTVTKDLRRLKSSKNKLTPKEYVKKFDGLYDQISFLQKESTNISNEVTSYMKEDADSLDMAHTTAVVTRDVAIGSVAVLATGGAAGLAAGAGMTGLGAAAFSVSGGTLAGTTASVLSDTVGNAQEKIVHKGMDMVSAYKSLDSDELIDSIDKAAIDNVQTAFLALGITPMVAATGATFKAVTGRLASSQMKTAQVAAKGLNVMKPAVYGGVIGSYDGFSRELVASQDVMKALDAGLSGGARGLMGGTLMIPAKGLSSKVTEKLSPYITRQKLSKKDFKNLSKGDFKKMSEDFKKMSKEEKNGVMELIKDMKSGRDVSKLTKIRQTITDELKTKSELMVMLSLGDIGLSAVQLKGFSDSLEQGNGTFQERLKSLDVDTVKSLMKDLTRKVFGDAATNLKLIKTPAQKAAFEKIIEAVYVNPVGQVTASGVKGVKSYGASIINGEGE